MSLIVVNYTIVDLRVLTWLAAAVVKLKAPRLMNFPSDTTVVIQLFPLTSSARDHVTHYYVAVVPANLRVASSDVRLDEVR